MTHVSNWLRVALLATVLPACADGFEDGEAVPDDDEPLAEREDPAYILSTTLWPFETIPVCWENPSTSNATERGWVKDAVEKTWEAVSAVDFTGWGTCTTSSKGIRIQIADAGAHVIDLGKLIDGVKNGMRLNFTFLNWNNKYCAGTNRESCIRVDAVHEFGHALGFAHEQNRTDKPATCTDAPQADNGDMVLGAYDPDSIMNYCNGTYDSRTWPWVMSNADTLAVQKMYGGNRRTIVESLGGNCLDIFNGGTANGQKVQFWDCLGNAHQQWTPNIFVRESFTSSIVGAGDNCLDVTGWSQDNGTKVQMWDCLNNAGQAFTMVDMEIVGLAGKCMDVKWGSTAPGTPVWLYSCSDDSAQKFYRDDGHIVRSSDGKCVTAAGDSNGAGLVMQPCDRLNSRQYWHLQDGGTFRNHQNNRCIAVAGTGTADGTSLVLADCSANIRQKWSLRGGLRGIGQNCIDVKDWSTANGTQAQMWDCTPNSIGQTFTYYP